MRICLVLADGNPRAGLGRAVGNIARGLATRGHTIGIVSASGTMEYDTCRVSLRASPTHPLRFVREVLKMRSFMRHYDVIIAYDVRPAGILAHIACLGLNKPVVIHAFGTYALFEQRSWLKNLLVRWAYTASARVFIINDFVKRCIEASGKNFTFGSTATIVSLGVDTSFFSPLPQPSYPYGRPYILSVGALKVRKGQLLAIQAFASIADAFPDLRYVLVGDVDSKSEYVRRIRQSISDADLSDRIHLVQGSTDAELIDLYSGALFFVLTPTTTPDFIEGLGMVYLEAALCQIPAIGTWNTGAEVAIEHNRSGLLVDNTIEAVARGMVTMLENDEMRKKYGAYARERALQLDWSHVSDRYESELQQLM